LDDELLLEIDIALQVLLDVRGAQEERPLTTRIATRRLSAWRSVVYPIK
jgi:hypothetical protein